MCYGTGEVGFRKKICHNHRIHPATYSQQNPIPESEQAVVTVVVFKAFLHQWQGTKKEDALQEHPLLIDLLKQ